MSRLEFKEKQDSVCVPSHFLSVMDKIFEAVSKSSAILDQLELKLAEYNSDAEDDRVLDLKVKEIDRFYSREQKKTLIAQEKWAKYSGLNIIEK